MIADCKLHGKKSLYLYVEMTGAKICRDCIAEGMYRDDIRAQAENVYPEHFTENFLALVGKTHSLKIHPQYFEEIVEGNKNFEIRKDDRDFNKGDRLVLKEFNLGGYTGREIVADVTLVVTYEQKEGYVVMGIKPREDTPIKREKSLNKTYRVTITLGNLSPNQYKHLSRLTDDLEDEEAEIIHFTVEND